MLESSRAENRIGTFLLCIRSDRLCRTPASLIPKAHRHHPHERWKLLCPIDCISIASARGKVRRNPDKQTWRGRGKVRDENKLRQRIKHRYELVSIVLTTLAPRPRNWLLGKFYCSHYRFIVIERGMERIPLGPAQSPSSAKVEILLSRGKSFQRKHRKIIIVNELRQCEVRCCRRGGSAVWGERKGLFLKDFRRHQFSHGGARSWEFSWPFFASEFSDFH